MKVIGKKIIIAAFCLILIDFNNFGVFANGDLYEPSELEIIANYQKNSFSFSTKDLVVYETKPMAEKNNYQVGSLSNQSLLPALHAVNFQRYVAGLQDDLVLNELYSSYAQHASYVNMLNGGLSHNPTKPSYLPQSIYDLGYQGAQSSNIAAGYVNLVDSIIYGYMWDEDPYNIATLGHRRWLLSPQMQEIGFGYVDALNGSPYRSFSAAYVMDKGRVAKADYDYLAWPAAGNMPIELMSDGLPWSVNLGDTYSNPSASLVSVSLKNLDSGKIYYFQSTSNQDPNQSEQKEFFTINNEGYAMGKCIIFRPKLGEISYSVNDRFEVSIKGIYRNGVETPIVYEVDLFSLFDQPSSWAMTELMTAQSSGLIPKEYGEAYKSNISRLDFSILLMNMLTKGSGYSMEELVQQYGNEVQGYYDTENKEVLAAANLGIVKGIGNGRFDPNGFITREAAATMLARAADLLTKMVSITRDTSITASYSDAAEISDWAKEGIMEIYQIIDTVNRKRVMEGISSGRFSPQETYTREQAMITMKRLFYSIRNS
ncbi:MAG: S-layer homology domain-containing protein [Vallitaleaceae bacterium]|nr:S-layer homology domain-containing protein [Vallitaleaceae bacterium]